MTQDESSPEFDAAELVGTTSRRTRMSPAVDPELRSWLRRAATCHAHLCWLIRLFGAPRTAGGQSLEGETFAARASRGDRTLLYDALGFVGDEVAELRDQIARKMDAASPTVARPGTAEKVAVMFARAERGDSLFIEGDAAT